MGVGVWQPQIEDESCLMSRWTGPKEVGLESHVSASFPGVLTSFFQIADFIPPDMKIFFKVLAQQLQQVGHLIRFKIL